MIPNISCSFRISKMECTNTFSILFINWICSPIRSSCKSVLHNRTLYQLLLSFTTTIGKLWEYNRNTPTNGFLASCITETGKIKDFLSRRKNPRENRGTKEVNRSSCPRRVSQNNNITHDNEILRNRIDRESFIGNSFQ